MLSRLRFYWVITACGGVLMALEILSSRILAPHFGNSVYVWGSIISVFLAALSLGYLWGGRLADRYPSMATLGRMVALAALCQGVLLLVGQRLAERMGELTGGTPAGTLLAATVLFGPASVMLGTVSPWAVRLAARDLGHLGNTAGRLFALSTGGSLAGTLACTFLFIPFLELRQTMALLTAITAATACLALAGAFRAEAPAAVLSALLLVFAGPVASFPRRGGSELVYERVTPYQTLQVLESEGVRRLLGDRVPQAAVRLADRRPALPYVRTLPAALLLAPGIERMLAIGLGGGSVGQYLQKHMPGLHIDYVDIDPAVPEIARRFFFFQEGPRTTVAIADGRRFLAASDKRWDFILCDAYIGQSVPFHLTTTEFLEEVKRHLEPGGVFCLNLAAGLNDPFSQAMYRTVRDRFESIYVFPVQGAPNVEVMATLDPSLIGRAELIARGRELDRTLGFDPSLAALAAQRRDVDFLTADVPVLTDEFAPVDRLIRLGEAARKNPPLGIAPAEPKDP